MYLLLHTKDTSCIVNYKMKSSGLVSIENIGGERGMSIARDTYPIGTHRRSRIGGGGGFKKA